MTFGDLRSAVMSCRQDPQRICDVVWCVLKSNMREEALRYAVDNLSTLTVKETVNLGDLIKWVVEGDDHLAVRIAVNHDVPDDVRYEYLSTWASLVLKDPKNSPTACLYYIADPNCDVLRSWPLSDSHGAVNAYGWVIEHYTDSHGKTDSMGFRVSYKSGISPHLRESK